MRRPKQRVETWLTDSRRGGGVVWWDGGRSDRVLEDHTARRPNRVTRFVIRFYRALELPAKSRTCINEQTIALVIGPT